LNRQGGRTRYQAREERLLLEVGIWELSETKISMKKTRHRQWASRWSFEGDISLMATSLKLKILLMPSSNLSIWNGNLPSVLEARDDRANESTLQKALEY